MNYDFIKIFDDVSAEKTLLQLKEKKEELDRIKNLCNKMIESYNDKIIEHQESYDEYEKAIKFHLNSYLETVNTKETATQYSYKLASAKIIKKKPVVELIKPSDISLIPKEFIKTTESIDWANYKKILSIVDGKVVNNDGEIVEIDLINKEGEIQIKF